MKKINEFPLTPAAPCSECICNPDRMAQFEKLVVVYCSHNMAGSIVFFDENGGYALACSYSPVSMGVFLSMVEAGNQAAPDLIKKAEDLKKKMDSPE